MNTTGIVQSPVGTLMVTTTANGVSNIHFCGNEQPPLDVAMTGDIADELAVYFAGERQSFSQQPDMSGASEFTHKVLEATAEIPYGETRTYGQIAASIGLPGATQAVGNALGANPVPIVIPCHRVIRSDGSMGWFTGGPDIKRALLAVEGVHFPQQTTLDL